MEKITLYIATHNITGLKYFGKTNRYLNELELQEKYHGSGTYWREHLKEHGDDVTMEIYGIYSLDEVEREALKFSFLNDIVKSNLWANMIVENGLDGGSIKGSKRNEETKLKMRKPKTEEHKNNMRKPKSEEHSSNISKGRKGIPSNFTQETLDKQNRNRKGMLGLTHSKDSKKLMSDRRKDKIGIKASNKIIVKIFDFKGNLFATSEGNFEALCKKHNLPCSALKKSYREITVLSNRKDEFNGWYTKKG